MDGTTWWNRFDVSIFNSEYQRQYDFPFCFIQYQYFYIDINNYKNNSVMTLTKKKKITKIDFEL